MKSKIINMADRLKDKEDKVLESLFGSEPVLDKGFSLKVMKRLNRRLWIRRLALPTAFLLGAAIQSARPCGLSMYDACMTRIGGPIMVWP